MRRNTDDVIHKNIGILENIYIDIDINVDEDREKNNDKDEVEVYTDEKIEKVEKKSLLKTVFSSKRINEEVAWKLHCIKEEKSYEEIASKYKVNSDKLKKMNNNQPLEEGKLIFIPLD